MADYRRHPLYRRHDRMVSWYDTMNKSLDWNTPLDFETVRKRLFKLMQEKADAGDEGAKWFIRGKIVHGKLVDPEDVTSPPEQTAKGGLV